MGSKWVQRGLGLLCSSLHYQVLWALSWYVATWGKTDVEMWNLECHVSSTEIERSVEWTLQGTHPVLHDIPCPSTSLASLSTLSDDDPNMLCAKKLKRAAGRNGTESRRHGLSSVVHRTGTYQRLAPGKNRWVSYIGFLCSCSTDLGKEIGTSRPCQDVLMDAAAHAPTARQHTLDSENQANL